MRKALLFIASMLLATTAAAQIGTPGFSGPLAGATLTGGTITGQTNATGAVFTGQTPFCFEGQTDNAFETCLRVIDPTADMNIYIPFSTPTTNPTFLVGGASYTYNAGGTIITQAPASGGSTITLSATSLVQDRYTGKITLNGDPLTGIVTLGVSNNAATRNTYLDVYPFGVTLNAWYGASFLITGDVPENYLGLPSIISDGVLDTVGFVVTDTTPSITGGYITMCGGRSLEQDHAAEIGCELIDISAGAGPYSSVGSYYSVISVKTTGMVGLGGAGDELLRASWGTDSTGDVFVDTNLTEHAPITYTNLSSVAGPGNFLLCADGVGVCTVSFTSGTVLAGAMDAQLTAAFGTFSFSDGATQIVRNSPRILSQSETTTFNYNDITGVWTENGGAVPSLTFEGGPDAFETEITVTDPTADRTVTFPDFSGTVVLSTTANEFDTGSSLWVNSGNLIFEGSTANNFEVAVNVLDPSEDRTISFPDSNGLVEIRSQAATSGSSENLLAMMIEGGYALDGTLTTTPASTVTVTLDDPEADSAPTQNVEICGYEDATNKTLYVLSCVILAAVEGAGNITVPSFVEVTHVKGAGKAGDDADDTIAVAFTTGPVTIRSATAIADSAKSDVTPSAAINGSAVALYCADAQGCDFQPGDPGAASDGRTLILMVKTGSTAIVVKDDDSLVDLSGDADLTLDDFDTLTLVWLEASNRWLQLAASNN